MVSTVCSSILCDASGYRVLYPQMHRFLANPGPRFHRWGRRNSANLLFGQIFPRAAWKCKKSIWLRGVHALHPIPYIPQYTNVCSRTTQFSKPTQWQIKDFPDRGCGPQNNCTKTKIFGPWHLGRTGRTPLNRPMLHALVQLELVYFQFMSGATPAEISSCFMLHKYQWNM